MRDPKVLLADEPTASLDLITSNNIMRLLSELASERKIAVLSVVHDRQAAERYCSRVLTIRDGQLCDGCTPSTSSAEPSSGVPLRRLQSLAVLQEEPGVVLSRSVSPRPTPWRSIGIGVAVVAVLLWAIAGIKIESRNVDGAFTRLVNFLGQLLPESLSAVFALPWAELTMALIETIRIAILGTAMGVVFSLPFAVLASARLMPRVVTETTRLFLNGIRAIPSLLWALLFTAAVGFGPLAGVLALSVYSVGYLTKFFYEAFEAVDQKAPEALRELGAKGVERFAFAIWPAARPAVLSSCFFMVEYNVRAASILGVVDAGGIGTLLKQYVDFRQFPTVLAGLSLILLVVLVLDTISRRLRLSLVAKG
jgi:phosphonate transport system permease protein